MIDVSIIIVSWNVSEFLFACLESLQRSQVEIVPPNQNIQHLSSRTTIEIIVVDSASSDNTLEMLKAFPDIRVLSQLTNLGFAKCNNIGLKFARGRYLFLLNPDAEIVNDAIQVMVDYLDKHHSVGVLGPFLTNANGSLQIMPRIFPNLTVILFETPSLEPYMSKKFLEYECVVNPPENAQIAVDWVLGAAMMARREVYDQIGLLDEKYPMYAEEIDWCFRAKEHQWKVICLGTAKVIHHGGKSSEKNPIVKKTYFWQSNIRYFQKYHRRFAFIVRVSIILSYTHMLLIEIAKLLLGHNFKEHKQEIKTYMKGLAAVIMYPYRLEQ